MAFHKSSNASSMADTLCMSAEQIVALWSHADPLALNEWSHKLLGQCYALRDELQLFAAESALNTNVSLP